MAEDFKAARRILLREGTPDCSFTFKGKDCITAWNYRMRRLADPCVPATPVDPCIPDGFSTPNAAADVATPIAILGVVPVPSDETVLVCDDLYPGEDLNSGTNEVTAPAGSVSVDVRLADIPNITDAQRERWSTFDSDMLEYFGEAGVSEEELRDALVLTASQAESFKEALDAARLFATEAATDIASTGLRCYKGNALLEYVCPFDTVPDGAPTVVSASAVQTATLPVKSLPFNKVGLVTEVERVLRPSLGTRATPLSMTLLHDGNVGAAAFKLEDGVLCGVTSDIRVPALAPEAGFSLTCSMTVTNTDFPGSKSGILLSNATKGDNDLYATMDNFVALLIATDGPGSSDEDNCKLLVRVDGGTVTEFPIDNFPTYGLSTFWLAFNRLYLRVVWNEDGLDFRWATDPAGAWTAFTNTPLVPDVDFSLAALVRVGPYIYSYSPAVDINASSTRTATFSDFSAEWFESVVNEQARMTAALLRRCRYDSEEVSAYCPSFELDPDTYPASPLLVRPSAGSPPAIRALQSDDEEAGYYSYAEGYTDHVTLAEGAVKVYVDPNAWPLPGTGVTQEVADTQAGESAAQALVSAGCFYGNDPLVEDCVETLEIELETVDDESLANVRSSTTYNPDPENLRVAVSSSTGVAVVINDYCAPLTTTTDTTTSPHNFALALRIRAEDQADPAIYMEGVISTLTSGEVTLYVTESAGTTGGPWNLKVANVYGLQLNANLVVSDTSKAEANLQAEERLASGMDCFWSAPGGTFGCQTQTLFYSEDALEAWAEVQPSPVVEPGVSVGFASAANYIDAPTVVGVGVGWIVSGINIQVGTKVTEVLVGGFNIDLATEDTSDGTDITFTPDWTSYNFESLTAATVTFISGQFVSYESYVDAIGLRTDAVSQSLVCEYGNFPVAMRCLPLADEFAGYVPANYRTSTGSPLGAAVTAQDFSRLPASLSGNSDTTVAGGTFVQPYPTCRASNDLKQGVCVDVDEEYDLSYCIDDNCVTSGLVTNTIMRVSAKAFSVELTEPYDQPSHEAAKAAANALASDFIIGAIQCQWRNLAISVYCGTESSDVSAWDPLTEDPILPTDQAERGRPPGGGIMYSKFSRGAGGSVDYAGSPVIVQAGTKFSSDREFGFVNAMREAATDGLFQLDCFYRSPQVTVTCGPNDTRNLTASAVLGDALSRVDVFQGVSGEPDAGDTVPPDAEGDEHTVEAHTGAGYDFPTFVLDRSVTVTQSKTAELYNEDDGAGTVTLAFEDDASTPSLNVAYLPGGPEKTIVMSAGALSSPSDYDALVDSAIVAAKTQATCIYTHAEVSWACPVFLGSNHKKNLEYVTIPTGTIISTDSKNTARKNAAKILDAMWAGAYARSPFTCDRKLKKAGPTTRVSLSRSSAATLLPEDPPECVVFADSLWSDETEAGTPTGTPVNIVAVSGGTHTFVEEGAFLVSYKLVAKFVEEGTALDVGTQPPVIRVSARIKAGGVVLDESTSSQILYLRQNLSGILYKVTITPGVPGIPGTSTSSSVASVPEEFEYRKIEPYATTLDGRVTVTGEAYVRITFDPVTSTDPDDLVLNLTLAPTICVEAWVEYWPGVPVDHAPASANPPVEVIDNTLTITRQ